MFLTALLLAAAPLSDAQLATRAGGKDVYPSAFRGAWATNAAMCSGLGDGEKMEIGAERIAATTSESVLVKASRVSRGTGSDGRESYRMTAMVAGSAGDEVYLSKLRLVLSGGKLFVTNADTVTDDIATADQYAYVRCAAPKAPAKSKR